jgi:tetratricopeptide (TPR) repeat protein
VAETNRAGRTTAAALAGERIVLLGRFAGASHRGLASAIAEAGGAVAPRLGRGVTMVVLAHEQARALFGGDAALDRLAGLPSRCALVSEITLRRRLGLTPPAPAEPRPFDAEALCRLAGLDPDLVAGLDLFDVLDPVGGQYGYRDLVAAREVVRLLQAGSGLCEIVEAAVALRRPGLRLSEARLAGTADGGVKRRVDGDVLDLDGQYRLPLAEPGETLDDVLAGAEDAENAGDLAAAARLYRRASAMDPHDPLAPFQLGNVLEAQGATADAAAAWLTAVRRVPEFADAWFNLAVLAEARGEPDKAADLYRRALARDPEHSDAAYNLGLMLARRQDYAAALPLLETFMRLEPGAPELPVARRRAAECRLALRGAADGTGEAERR